MSSATQPFAMINLCLSILKCEYISLCPKFDSEPKSAIARYETIKIVSDLLKHGPYPSLQPMLGPPAVVVRTTWNGTPKFQSILRPHKWTYPRSSWGKYDHGVQLDQSMVQLVHPGPSLHGAQTTKYLLKCTGGPCVQGPTVQWSSLKTNLSQLKFL